MHHEAVHRLQLHRRYYAASKRAWGGRSTGAGYRSTPAKVKRLNKAGTLFTAGLVLRRHGQSPVRHYINSIEVHLGTHPHRELSYMGHANVAYEELALAASPFFF